MGDANEERFAGLGKEIIRIFKKRKTETFTWPCDLWPQEAIEKLISTGKTDIECE